ncbi:hypothetical protein [Clostridium perfringens]|uniref:hypothetical protein n=1 Tax=Clostridium perfringens TaxID=1502 RepID=UPI00024960A9|nr:hypothetical protein [Clostridium perfringens]EHP47417.1 hypothetical protein HMPREF9476_02156 [Clostridium perfringens WAL-14572]
MKSSKKKKRIKELYRKGYNSSEIARIITKENRAEGIFKVTTREAIKKCIQRNFKEYKKEHKINAVARKEVIKAVDYEAKKYIGDRALILKNRSVYETKKDGDIVLKKKKILILFLLEICQRDWLMKIKLKIKNQILN